MKVHVYYDFSTLYFFIPIVHRQWNLHRSKSIVSRKKYDISKLSLFSAINGNDLLQVSVTSWIMYSNLCVIKNKKKMNWEKNWLTILLLVYPRSNPVRCCGTCWYVRISGFCPGGIRRWHLQTTYDFRSLEFILNKEGEFLKG